MRLIRCILLAAVASGTVAAQSPPSQQGAPPTPDSRPQPPARPTRPFTGGIEVVMVTATVLNKDGELASGLGRDDFQLLEDSVVQPITHFSAERVPVSLGLLLDISDSMRGERIKDARAAVGRFLFDLLAPDDEFFVMTFNHEPALLVPWTHEPDQARPRLDSIRPWGSTAIYDAMLAALPEFNTRSRQRAAIVLISDGADTASDANVRDVRTALLRSDAFVYAVAIDSPDKTPINRSIEPYTLRELTDDSGGRTEVVHNTSELGAATARIADDLNHQYVLGYSPSHKPDGQYHTIRLRVTKEGYRVRARRGYVAGPRND